MTCRTGQSLSYSVKQTLVFCRFYIGKGPTLQRVPQYVTRNVDEISSLQRRPISALRTTSIDNRSKDLYYHGQT